MKKIEDHIKVSISTILIHILYQGKAYSNKKRFELETSHPCYFITVVKIYK